VSGSVVQKGESVNGDVKVNATVMDQNIDLELNQDAKAKVTASFPSLIPNGKLSVGGAVQDLESFKVSASVVTGPLGLKADVANYAAPKADASVCYAVGGGLALGAMATFKPSAPLAYAVAAQSKQGDLTYALTASDQLKTFKASVVAALDGKQNVGAEVLYKKTATATVGYSKKMDGHSFKAVVSNPLAAEVNPTVSFQASLSNLLPKTTATLSAQVDKSVRAPRDADDNDDTRTTTTTAPLVKQSPRSSCADGCRGLPTITMLEDGARALRARRAINSINISRRETDHDDEKKKENKRRNHRLTRALSPFSPFKPTDEVQVRLSVLHQALEILQTSRPGEPIAA